MYIVIDRREIVSEGYVSGFDREGISAQGFAPEHFRDWISTAPERELDCLEAVLLGECDERDSLPRAVRDKILVPIIALNERSSLEETLQLFASGVDDVVRKPVHIREIVVRVSAIRRRTEVSSETSSYNELVVYHDGRDPEINGEVLVLPRRERRILEYLMKNRGRRATKEQIFNTIYGVFNENAEESVIESHISKLRKKLRDRMGYDPIDSKRYLGYRIGE
jgi:DNA-binding response OmpR family regulator